MKDTLLCKGVAANEEKAFSLRLQSITSFCPRVAQIEAEKLSEQGEHTH